MAAIIAITNQKGGVGKTTTTVNLAASFAKREQRTLLIDLDPQANATTGSGVDKISLENSINDVLLGNCSASDALITTEAGFDILASNADLTEAEVKLIQTSGNEDKLRKALSPIAANYDFILLDCPPALNSLTLNALVAANSVMITMQCEYYALEGLTALLKTIEDVKSGVNPGLSIEGILRTMYDGRSRLSQDVSEQLFEHFGDKVYRTVIPRNIRLAEAPSHGMPVLLYDKNSQGASAYLVLAGEVMKRQKSLSESKAIEAA